MNAPEEPRVFVDADACPARDEIRLVCQRHKCAPVFVANKPIAALAHDPAVRMVTHARAGDLLLTADLLLAQRAVKQHIDVMNFSGGWLSDDVIHDLVARREIQQYLREMNLPSHKPVPYDKRNRSGLRAALHQWFERRRNAGGA